MTSLEFPVNASSRSDFEPEALELAVSLTRWGITQEARGDRLVLSASDGVMLGVERSLLGWILAHAEGLYRIARLTADMDDPTAR